MTLGLPPKYVLDEMTSIESAALIDNAHMRHKDSWEQARFMGMCAVSPYSKKQMKAEDLLKFPWDSNDLEPLDEERLKELEKQAKKYEQRWQQVM